MAGPRGMERNMTTSIGTTSMFEFHVESMDKPVPGIGARLVFDTSRGGGVSFRAAVLGARLDRARVEGSDREVLVPHDEWDAGRLAWESLDNEPHMSADGSLFLRGTFVRSRRILVCGTSEGDKRLSLRTRTGLFGSQDYTARLIAAMPVDPTDPGRTKRLIHPHGMYAMDKVVGAEHILDGYDFEAELVRHVQGRSFGYVRKVPTGKGEMRVYAQRVDAFNTKPGAELLGSGCLPNMICRIIHDEKAGYVVERYTRDTSEGKHWDEAFLETAWNFANRSKRGEAAASA